MIIYIFLSNDSVAHRFKQKFTYCEHLKIRIVVSYLYRKYNAVSVINMLASSEWMCIYKRLEKERACWHHIFTLSDSLYAPCCSSGKNDCDRVTSGHRTILGVNQQLLFCSAFMPLFYRRVRYFNRTMNNEHSTHSTIFLASCPASIKRWIAFTDSTVNTFYWHVSPLARVNAPLQPLINL